MRVCLSAGCCGSPERGRVHFYPRPDTTSTHTLTHLYFACLQPIEIICLDFQGYRIMSAKKKESKLTSSEISQQHEQAAGTKQNKKRKRKEEKKERIRNGEIIWKIISSLFFVM